MTAVVAVASLVTAFLALAALAVLLAVAFLRLSVLDEDLARDDAAGSGGSTRTRGAASQQGRG